MTIFLIAIILTVILILVLSKRWDIDHYGTRLGSSNNNFATGPTNTAIISLAEPITVGEPASLEKLRAVYRCLSQARTHNSAPEVLFDLDHIYINKTLEDIDISLKMYYGAQNDFDRHVFGKQLFEKVFPDASCCAGLFDPNRPQDLIVRIWPHGSQWIYADTCTYSPSDYFELSIIVFKFPISFAPSLSENKHQTLDKYIELVKQ